MICGTCRGPFADITKWKAHIQETGCDWHRDAWVKHLEALRLRHPLTARRHLSKAMPHLWKPGPPMSEEKKAKLRAIGAKRVKVKKSDLEKIREADAAAKRKKRKRQRRRKVLV